ncbi:BspA family leucine-rich repeat surface protein [Carboxylicivirga sp. RSCT41]|uniref:BspA family leucine-rich repeat surface protein n=1 Tax=Carboxylicivirga agarovorans TaxID=3417570 RepID=UPI003D334158
MPRLFFSITLTLFLSISAFAQRAFITTWKTTKSNETITIPTLGTGYNFGIDWGDGSIQAFSDGDDFEHTYSNAGIYTIKITGDFPRIFFYDSPDKEKILSIEQWGDIEWANMSQAFYGCYNLTSNATDVPILSNVTVMHGMFQGARKYNGSSHPDGQIGNWGVDSVQNMSHMFHDAYTFNQDISNWNVSNVQSMSNMFFSANSFNNGGQPLNWDAKTANVRTMEQMFRSNDAFNQDISNWDVRSVKNMSYMFMLSDGFNNNNQPLNWGDKTAKVETMRNMFYKASIFNQDISEWSIRSLKDATKMLDYCGMSSSNYDKLLIAWNNQVQASLGGADEIVEIVFGAEEITYCVGDNARKQLIDAGWGNGKAGDQSGDYKDITDGGKNRPDHLYINDSRITACRNTELNLTHIIDEENLTASWQAKITGGWQVNGETSPISDPTAYKLSNYKNNDLIVISYNIEEEHCGETIRGTAALYLSITDELHLKNRNINICGANHAIINLYHLMGFYGSGTWEYVNGNNADGDPLTLTTDVFNSGNYSLEISQLAALDAIGGSSFLVFKYTPDNDCLLNTGDITLTIYIL